MSSFNIYITFLALLCILPLSFQSVRYDGHQVFRIYAGHKASHSTFFQLTKHLNLDVWTETITDSRPIDIRVPPQHIPEVTQILKKNEFKYEITIYDVQVLIDEQEKSRNDCGCWSFKDDSFYQQYHTYEEIISWVKQITNDYPNTELINVGTSYEGREQLAVRVFSNSGNDSKPALWFDGGIHAREWISTAAVVYMLGHIITDSESDSRVQNLLSEFDIYVMLILNPDGYAYTWGGDRMWRKNRRPNNGSVCVGIDLNRNWDYHWGDSTQISDTLPCSEAYRGPYAFSEVEVLNVANYLSTIPNLQGYINFHSYSQLWMYPWSYTTDPAPDFNDLDAQGSQVCKSIGTAYGTVYEWGQISTIIYTAYGSSVDWLYGTLNVTYSIGVELRDTGEYGFLLPADQIVPSGVETLNGYFTYAQYIADHNKK